MANKLPARPSRRRLLQATGALAAPYFFTKSAAAQDPKRIVVYNFDGVVGQFYTDNWIKPFQEKFDVRVDTILIAGSEAPLDKLIAQVKAGRPESDVIYLQPPALVIAERNDMFIPLDGKLPEAAKYPADYMTKWGPKLTPYCYGLAYNTAKMKMPPTRWRDMWDPAYRKQVAVNDAVFEQTLQMVNLTFTGQLTPINAATFQHLTELRPNLASLWTTGAQAEQLFRTGEIIMSPLWNGRTFALADQGVPVDFLVPEEGMLVRWNSASVPRGSRNPDLAIQYINYIMSDGPQQLLVDKLFYASPNRNVTYTADTSRRVVLAGEKNLKLAKFEDFVAIADQKGDWAKQWEVWKSS